MEWVEVTGKTLDEAKDRALDHLGVDESQAEFEVLETPRAGWFGRMKGEARVRARVLPARPRPKAERRDRRRGRSREGGGRDDGTREPRAPRQGASDRKERSELTGAVPSDATGAPPPARGRDARAEPALPAAGAPVGAGVTLPSAPKEGASPPPEPSADEREPDVNESEGTQTEGSAQQLDQATAFLTGLVEAFGLEAEVRGEQVDPELDEVQVQGADLGLLIGPKAATLEAIQELTRVAVQRRSGGRAESRLRVDIGGYRQRRREALERFARQQADQVLASGRQVVLEPMSSADRKVVHDCLSAVDGVTTLSEGEDPRRRVVIAPRKP